MEKEKAAKAEETLDASEDAQPDHDFKKTGEGEEDDEDMDEETEIMYAQAVAEQVEESDDEQEEDDHPPQVPMGVEGLTNQFSASPGPKSAAVRSRAGKSAVPVGCGKKSTAGRTAAGGPGRGSSKAAAAPVPAVALPARDPSLVPSHHVGWSKVTTVHSLDLQSVQSCRLFKAPKSLKDSKKWTVEFAKLTSFVSDLANLLGGGSQVKDQQIKSHITSIKRVNDKNDKRTGYESKPDCFSKRCQSLRLIMESSRDLRADVLAARFQI